MEPEQTETLFPAHMGNERVTIQVAAYLSGMTYQGLRYAILHGNLKGTPMPTTGGQIHWQVKIADLADYTRKPLSAEWLAVVEECLNWTPGKEVRRVA